MSKFKQVKVDMEKASDAKRTIEAFQSNVQNALDPVLDNPILNGTLLTADLVINEDNLIPHGLARPYKAFTVFGNENTGVNVWISATQNNLQDKYIILQASNTATFTLWII